MHSHHHHHPSSAADFSHRIFESSSISGRYAHHPHRPHHHHHATHLRMTPSGGVLDGGLDHPCFTSHDALCDNSGNRPPATLFPPPALPSILPVEDGGCGCESCLYISSFSARSDRVYPPDHVHQFSGSSSFTISPDSQCSVYATAAAAAAAAGGGGASVDHYLYLNRMDDLQLAYNQAYFAEEEEVGDSAEEVVYLNRPTRRRRRIQACSRSSSLTRSSPRKTALAEDHKHQAQNPDLPFASGEEYAKRHSACAQFTTWIAALSLEGAHLLELALHIYQRVCRLRKQKHGDSGSGDHPAGARNDDPSLNLACCLWIASKLEERQVNVPAAAEVAAAARIETKALATREMELMALMEWRPLKDWIAPR